MPAIGEPAAECQRLDVNENLGEGLLTVAFTGGVGQASRGSPGLHLVGGHVYAFAAHGGRSDIGVFDCL